MIHIFRPRLLERHFADDIFKCVFLIENVLILVEISLDFVPKGSIDNKPTLVQIAAWRRSGDNTSSEPMMGYLKDPYMWHSASMILMAILVEEREPVHSVINYGSIYTQHYT